MIGWGRLVNVLAVVRVACKGAIVMWPACFKAVIVNSVTVLWSGECSYDSQRTLTFYSFFFKKKFLYPVLLYLTHQSQDM